VRFEITSLGVSLAVAFAALGLVACGSNGSGDANDSTTTVATTAS
jgi:ABC-type phosphate transport system substrate-binding protein